MTIVHRIWPSANMSNYIIFKGHKQTYVYNLKKIQIHYVHVSFLTAHYITQNNNKNINTNTRSFPLSPTYGPSQVPGQHSHVRPQCSVVKQDNDGQTADQDDQTDSANSTCGRSKVRRADQLSHLNRCVIVVKCVIKTICLDDLHWVND